jgi:hypothetical protein
MTPEPGIRGGKSRLPLASWNQLCLREPNICRAKFAEPSLQTKFAEPSLPSRYPDPLSLLDIEIAIGIDTT